MAELQVLWSSQKAQDWAKSEQTPSAHHQKGLAMRALLKGKKPTPEQAKALKFARGTYQRALILGLIQWSRAGLKGGAVKYSPRYGRSRCHLLERLEENEVAWLVCARHGRFELVYVKPGDGMEKVQGRHHPVWRRKKT